MPPTRFAHPVPLALLLLVATLAPATPSHAAAKPDASPATADAYMFRWMSPMGARAAGLPRAVDPDAAAAVPPVVPFTPHALRALPGLAALTASGPDVPVHSVPAAGTQSETSIATNTGGTVVVVGFNDSRGAPAPGVTTYSLSGVARSADGGQTWFDVPVGPGGQSTMPTAVNGAVFGDPDVKYDPTHDVFVYCSIYSRPSDGRQGMCVNVSNASGSSWSAPREVTPTFINLHSGDKPFMDVNRNTGRILVSWTDFSSTTSAIRTTYSDDLGMTWSAATTLATGSGTSFVQASEPRFLPGATNATSLAYVVWENGTGTSRNVGCSRSTDGGATWSPPVNLDGTSFAPEDAILGVDRINASPSLAIDATTGRVYVVYQANNATGTGDVALRSFVGLPATGARVALSADPGNDRAQFMPAACVDASTGRVHVVWYDQGVHTSGDLIELMHTSSADQGATWSRPAPIFDRPYHAGYGNDPGEPNLGDYLQAVAANGVLHTVATNTSEVETFDEGLPGGALFSPDVYHDAEADNANLAALRLGAVTFTEACVAQANGALDPGETAAFTFPLRNYVGNAAVGAATYHTVNATLVSLTAGVNVLAATQPYGDIAPLATVANAAPFQVSLDPSFPPGADAILRLDVTTDQGATSLRYRLETGTAGAPTVLLNENFESVTPPALPAGWASAIGGTSANDPWVTTSSPPGGYGSGSKWAFHAETTTQEWMRLFSPIVTVPSATNAAVTLDFDLAYSTEVEATQSVTAYDGLTLRITDQTGGTAIRSVLAEAFADAITTGTSEHFPRHLPRSNATNYFPDMSVWAGNSGSVKHVSMRFPGAGLMGRSIQLRFEYTQDASGNCTSNGFPTPCGVGIDNVQLRLVPATAGFTRTTTGTGVTSDINPSTTGQTVTLTATVTPGGASGTVEFFDGLTSLGTAPVAGGAASLPVSTLTAGSHSITATYAGDACDATSTSPAYAQQVNGASAVGDGRAPALAITRVAPNPAAGAATIAYAVPHAGVVDLAVYDLTGRRVRTLTHAALLPGDQAVRWAADDDRGGALGAGVYYVRLVTADGTRTSRIVLAK